MADFITDTNHYFSKGNQLFDLKEYDKAIISAHLSRNGNSDNIIYMNIGISYCAKGDYRKAAKNYAISLAIKSDCSMALNGYGFSLFNLGKYDEAILKFQKAAEVDSKYTQGRLNWGLALYCMKEEAEAERIIEEALRNNWLRRTEIVARYEFQLSLAEERLAKVENEERKALLKEQICGYRWMLEFVPYKIDYLEVEDLYL